MMEKKKSYWTYSHGVSCLIPKKRGEGFLRLPIGHHVNDLSRWIDDNIRYRGHAIPTVVGLDGYLHFELGYLSKEDENHIINDIINPLGEFLNCTFELWEHERFLNFVLAHT